MYIAHSYFAFTHANVVRDPPIMLKSFTYYATLLKTLPIMLTDIEIFIPQFPCIACKFALLQVNSTYLKHRL